MKRIGSLRTCPEEDVTEEKTESSTLEEAYEDRNLLVMLLALSAPKLGWYACWAEGTDSEWPLIYIYLAYPMGQISYHVPRSHPAWRNIEQVVPKASENPWDGHNLVVKRDRILITVGSLTGEAESRRFAAPTELEELRKIAKLAREAITVQDSLGTSITNPRTSIDVLASVLTRYENAGKVDGTPLPVPKTVHGHEQFTASLRAAQMFHSTVQDKRGRPSFLHPLRVIQGVDDGSASEENYRAITVAALHDVIEDTNATLPLLSDMGLEKEVVEAVDAISRRKGEKYWAYIERVKLNPLARKVKLADATENLNRKDGMDDYFLSLKKRYRRVIEMLSEKP